MIPFDLVPAPIDLNNLQPHEYVWSFNFPAYRDCNIATIESNGCVLLALTDSIAELQVLYMALRNRLFNFHIPYVKSFIYIEINAANAVLHLAYRKRYLEIHQGDRSRFTGNHAGWIWSLNTFDREVLRVVA